MPEPPTEAIEIVAKLQNSMPSGVTVTPAGRMFLCFPRWVDPLKCTVAELRKGELVPYPDAKTNRINVCDPVHRFFSVQSVVATDDRTLWALDTGRPYFMPALPGAAKLVEIDLASGTIRRTYVVPYGVMRLTSYLNDVRIAPDRGAGGTAYITDSATLGPSALIVIDLATGRKLRRLDGHVSVQPDHHVVPVFEGRRLVVRFPFGLTLPYRFGADGITMSPDGATLYYCALTGKRLYSVDAEVLANPRASDAECIATVRDLCEKGVSDGLECDRNGRIYAGDLENRSVMSRLGDGPWELVVHDERLLWIDTLAISHDDRLLYFTSTQVERLWPFHAFCDLRKPPYLVARMRLGARAGSPS